jgi:hypothetical protein
MFFAPSSAGVSIAPVMVAFVLTVIDGLLK